MMFCALLVLFSVGTNNVFGEESTPNDPFLSPTSMTKQVARDCQELQATSHDVLVSGMYLIQPLTYKTPFYVYCDFTTDGGGWTVIQRRVDGSIDFDRGWEDYKQGIGNLQTDFWLGNEKIAALTAQKKYQLRIELTGKTDTPRYAKYSSFRLGKETIHYQLFLGSYSGNAGEDCLDIHRNMYFTTYDADHDQHDRNCADWNTGGWWFKACDKSHLNGVWMIEDDSSRAIEWARHPGGSTALTFTEMKIRAA